MTKFSLLLCGIVPWLAVAAPNPAVPQAAWRLNLNDPAVAASLKGAELLPQGGPDGAPAIRIKGPAAPELVISSESFRDGVVSIRAKVKGMRSSRNFGECLYLRAAYPVMSREDWLYRPPAVRALNAPDWQDYAISCHIPSYAGNFKLIFGHAGKDGDVCYSDVRIELLPRTAAFNPKHALKEPQQTRFRGAVFGQVKDEESIRIFAQDWGGNLVRWQFTGGPGSFTPNRYRSWIRENIAKLDAVMPYFKKYGLKVVIDLHRGPGEMNYVMNNLGVWEKSTQDLIAESWRVIAEHYRDNANIYGYDLLNEPVDNSYNPASGALEWHRFAERLTGEIRKIDPDTPIIVEPVGMGMMGLRPLNFPNMIYSPHIYEPGEYTHQNVGRGRQTYHRYPDRSKGWDREWLRQIAKPVRDFQQKYRVPIYVGEFGVARWAEGNDQWLEDWISIFEEYGWDWTFHAYREASVWNVEMKGDREHPEPDLNSARKQVILKYFQRNQK